MAREQELKEFFTAKIAELSPPLTGEAKQKAFEEFQRTNPNATQAVDAEKLLRKSENLKANVRGTLKSVVSPIANARREEILRGEFLKQFSPLAGEHGTKALIGAGGVAAGAGAATLAGKVFGKKAPTGVMAAIAKNPRMAAALGLGGALGAGYVAGSH
jgi:cell division ATPase FtsA